MKKMSVKDQFRLWWSNVKWFISTRKRIKIYNYCQLYGKEFVIANIEKQIRKAESKRQYVAVGNMKALVRDIKDEAYDTTVD